MTTEEAYRRLEELKGALSRFDWEAVRSMCRDIVDDVWRTSAPPPAPILKEMLNQVRRKRQFVTLERFAEGFLMAGINAPTVRQQYAQTLIEQARFAAAEYGLRSLLGEPKDSSPYREASGLIGRTNKQIYVDAHGLGPAACLPFLERAIESYGASMTRIGLRTTGTTSMWRRCPPAS